MNHLPRLFGHRKQPGMDPKKKTRRKQPKLERRNAAKHFEYDAGSSSSSSRDSSSASSSLLYTRSVELYDRTSFRIEGVEGEFDRICRSLGLSGPEDFSIPPAAWEAMKVRSSSDILPRLKHGDSDEESKQKEEIEVRRPNHGGADDESKEKEEIGVLECGDQARVPVRGESSVCCAGGGGINGFRPPMLKPPPGIRVPAVDDACSTWDIFRDFAPKEEQGKETCAELRGSDDDGGREAMEEEGEEEEKEEENALRIAEIVGEFSACSFTTSNEDDSSSISTDPRSNNISPNGTIRRFITPGNWQKGDLLGRGSFGSVYEGISE